MKNEKTVYLPPDFDINSFVTSLLIYDKIKCSVYTLICYIFRYIPKKFHKLLLELDIIEIWDIYINDPLEGWYDEMKCHYTAHFGYNEIEFEKLVSKIREKSHKYSRKNMDVELLKKIMFKENGESRETVEFLNLYDAIKILKTKYYSTRDINLLTSSISLPDVRIDMGKNDVIFEINRFPDLSKDIMLNNFNFEKYLALREKEGAKLLREVIFKEKNYNNPDELLREYNEIVLREGLYSNKARERSFWGLSNGLSISGVFSGNIIVTIIITSLSVLSGNHRLIYKSSNDKLESFIKKDLRGFIDSISTNA